MAEWTDVFAELDKRIARLEAQAGVTPAQPSPTAPASNTKHPSDVLDLRNWTIMLPAGGQGDPDNEYLIGKSVPHVLFVEDGAVVFQATAGGIHSSGSKYARSEARQMKDAKWGKAAWSSSGSHSLEVDLAIDTSGLVQRKRINGIQIHNGSDDVCQVMRHETQGLGLMHADGKSWEPIDPGYNGQRFTCKVVAEANRIKVFYNGVLKVDVAKKGSGWFWKFGCYLQTDVPTWGEAPTAAGRVKVWRYALTGGAT